MVKKHFVKLEKVKGIDLKLAKSLQGAGVKDEAALLKIKQADIPGLAKKAGVSEKDLDKWVELADLMRIKGVGTQYAEALNSIGVDSVKEFRTRNAENLLKKMEEYIKAHPKDLQKLPTIKQMNKWIDHAKRLPDPGIN